MLAVPAAIPVKTPDDEPMVATSVLLLVHVPPAGVLLTVVVRPTHTLKVPVIVVGSALTVIEDVAAQPLGNV